jgi:uncharacterized damage-inducible protein DinB
MTTLQSLFAHMAWADQRALASLQTGAAPPQARELYAHVVAVERVWLDRIHGNPTPFSTWPSFDLERSAALSRENASAYEAYLRDLGPAGLDREIAYVNSAGEGFRSRVEDILLQVFLHGQYHRGQIAAQVRQAGGTPSPTDYIAFIRGAPAATRQGPG